jgi:hypothetical protein
MNHITARQRALTGAQPAVIDLKRPQIHRLLRRLGASYAGENIGSHELLQMARGANGTFENGQLLEIELATKDRRCPR